MVQLRCARSIQFILLTLLLWGCFISSSVQAQTNAQELFIVSQKAFEDGFYDVAIRYIEQLFQDHPQTDKRAQAQLLLGQCYFFKHQYLKAYEIFQELHEQKKLPDASLFWLGETYLKGNDYAKAERHYQTLLRQHPSSPYVPQAYYALGWAAFEQTDFTTAGQYFLTLVRKFPAHELNEDASFKLGEAAYHLRQYPLTVNYFKNYILNHTQSTRHAEAYFYIGESLYYQEKYLEALSYYAKAADKGYDNQLILMARVSMTWSYIKLGKLELAQQQLDNALSLSQDKNILTDDVYLAQATLYTEQKQFKEAVQAYAQLIQAFPNSHRLDEAYLGEANAYYLLEDYGRAIESYKLLIQRLNTLTPQPKTLEKAYFGIAWAQLKNGQIDDAVKSFETIKNKSESITVKISALTQIGDAYQDIEQFEKAVAIYDRILENFPDSQYTDYVQYRQGIALLKSGAITAATLSFQTLKANFPESKYLNNIAYYTGVAYFQKGDWAGAKEHMTEFIQDTDLTHDFSAEAHYVLALSHFNLKNYGQAMKLFQKIKTNFPYKSSMVRNAQISMAKCYYKTGNIKEALKRFKILISRYPQSEIAQEALLWLSEFYFESGDLDNAIIYYNNLIEQFPGSDKLNLVYYDLGHIYQARDEYDQAINALKRVDNKNEHLYAKAKLAIADIFSRQFDSSKAIEIYENIIISSPEFQRTAHVKLADVFKQHAAYDKALKSYQNALTSKMRLSDVHNAEIQFAIGDTLELLNQPEKAIEEYLKISYLYPEATPWIIKSYLRTGRIFEDRQRWDKAQKIYEKVLVLGTLEAKFARERLDWIATHTTTKP